MEYLHDGVGTNTSVNSNFDNTPLLGTGPYTVTQVSENTYVEFQQNPNYLGNERYLASCFTTGL